MTVRDALNQAIGAFEAAGCATPRVDAELIVSHVLGAPRTELYAGPERSLAQPEEERIREAVSRRTRREPVAYIVGEWGFRKLVLSLDSRVLVPRPETEVLVERCLVRLEGIGEPRVLDIGTGSGAIALSIASERPGALVVATDISSDALAVASANRTRHRLEESVQLVLGHLSARLTGPFDLVVSNPPYVRPEDFDALEPEIRLFEPREAIVGVGVHAAIARRAHGLLRSGGWLVLECGDGQNEEVGLELAASGYREVAAWPDLTGRARVVEGRKK